MRLTDADWLTDAATQSVFALLHRFPTYAVGGCVRNTLLGAAVKDIDISTSATPEQVSQIATDAGIRVIPTGVEHGTITVVVNDVPFEITTFRRDVETDGRRAVVAFAETMEEDARRRDFTMNAIYADAAGELHDPVGGLDDLAERRVRFIEDAGRRIREDYLRSLRFFRFCAWYGDPARGMDEVALDAIARNLEGLATLSRERVGSELLRLLEAPDPAPAVAAMRATGVLPVVLPGSDDRALSPLVALEASVGAPVDAVRRLAVLGGDYGTLRLSRADERKVALLRQNAATHPAELGYRHGAELGRDVLLVSAASLGQHIPEESLQAINSGADAKFPVKADDLMPALQGKALGDTLRRLEDAWIASGFTLTRKALLSMG